MSVDLVIADPPYLFTTASSGAGKLNPWADISNASYWFAAWYREVFRILKPTGAMWTFLNWRTIPTVMKATLEIGQQIESLLVWDKQWIGPGGPRGLRPSYELVALICNPEYAVVDRGVYDIQRFPWSSIKPTGHPAEKPPALINWLLGLQPCELVVDPFCGSGTVPICCRTLGKDFIAFELSEEWQIKATRRITEQTQGNLFGEESAPKSKGSRETAYNKPQPPEQLNLLDTP